MFYKNQLKIVVIKIIPTFLDFFQILMGLILILLGQC